MADAKDPFDDARPGFIKLDDLLGRLCLITAREIGERESTQSGSAGKMYKFVVTDTVVLDGDVNDEIEEVPLKLEDFQWSGTRVVGTLQPKIRTGRLCLGRLTQVHQKGRTPSWELEAPTDADKVIARKYLESIENDAFN